MQAMISFVQNYPLVSAIVVAMVSLLAIASELFLFNEKILAICTTFMGFLGIVATFGGAKNFGTFSVLGVTITLLAYSSVSLWIWIRWTDAKGS